LSQEANYAGEFLWLINLMTENFYWAASVGAILVAAVYFQVWPKPASATHAAARPLFLRLILRWGHSVVWLLLALFFIGRTGRLGQPAEFWQPVGLSAFCMYGVFLLACYYDRNRLRPG
jgi:bacteriorhodopsin